MEVDREEINKFEELAERWWDPESEFKPLHQINPLRLTWIDNTVNGLNGLSVLDLGCGGGILSEAMSKLGANVTGVDPAERSIKVAKIHAEKSNSDVNYLCGSSETLAESMYESYDVVTCMEMLEHVTSPEKEIEACSSLLKSGGTLIVSTLTETSKVFFCNSWSGIHFTAFAKRNAQL